MNQNILNGQEPALRCLSSRRIVPGFPEAVMQILESLPGVLPAEDILHPPEKLMIFFVEEEF